MRPANNAGSNVSMKEKKREQLAKHTEAFLASGGNIYKADATENKIAKPSRRCGIGFNRYQQKDIRRRLWRGQTPEHIAELYGVRVERIQNIANGNSYKVNK